MKKILKIVILWLFNLFSISCSNEQYLIPDNAVKTINSLDLSEMKLDILNAYYEVTNGSNTLGTRIALKFSDNILSIFSENGNHALLYYVSKTDSTIQYSGIFKSVHSSRIQNKLDITLNINDKNNIKIGIKNGNTDNDVILKKKFAENILDPQIIFAHRAGSAQGTCYPAPENSLASLKLIECFGANGAEIDVRSTKDEVPVVFHDDNITPRTCDSKFCIGSISNFYLEHLNRYCRLYNAENIPTLELMLRFIVDSTAIKYVWLDMKYSNIMRKVMKLVVYYNDLAIKKNRNLEIVVGIPDENIMNAYLIDSLKNECPSLCEIGPNEAIKCGSKYWAPRWNAGIEAAETVRLRKLGIKTVYWPVNDVDVIMDILRKSVSDGILTDYSPLAYFKNYEINH